MMTKLKHGVLVVALALPFALLSIAAHAEDHHGGGGRDFHGGGDFRGGHFRGGGGFGIGFGWWGWDPYWYPAQYYYPGPYPYPYPYPYAYPYAYAPYPASAPPYPPSGPQASPAQQASAGAPPPQFWYYCDDPKGYYPQVPNCPTAWHEVSATPPTAGATVTPQKKK